MFTRNADVFAPQASLFWDLPYIGYYNHVMNLVSSNNWPQYFWSYVLATAPSLSTYITSN